MIFVDTGAFLGRWLARDQHHSAAVAGWESLSQDGARCYTSSLVLSETLTLLARRASYEFAAARARNLFAADRLEILRSSPEVEISSLQDFERFADQQVSFADCVSFTLMRQHRISRAFTFDRHFRLAGFEAWPS